MNPFSFADLLVLLGGTMPFVDTSGRLRFRSGLNHLWRAPDAFLRVTPAFLDFSITSFADTAIWKHLFGWVTSYLDDTLVKARKVRSDHRLMRGHGLVVELAYTPPRGDLSASDALIELAARRDETHHDARARIFAVPSLEGRSSTGDMSLEVTRGEGDVEVRWSSPQHDGRESAASKCWWWCGHWLKILTGDAKGRGEATIFPATEGEIVLDRLARGSRRDEARLRAPASWLAL